MAKLYGKGTIKELVKGRKYHLCLSAGKDPLSGQVLSSKERVPDNAIACDEDGTPTVPELRYADATPEQRAAIAWWKEPVRYLKAQETFLGTRRQAELRIEQMRRELEQGRALNADKVTIASWIEQYLANRESAGKVRPATLRSNRGVAKHIISGLGTVRVVDLTPAMVNGFYTRLRVNGVGDTTVHMCHKLLKAVMNDAVNNDIILRNPVLRADAPRKPKPKRHALSMDEAARLARICSSGTPTANKVAVYLGLALGARLGEVLGLQWQHVVLDSTAGKGQGEQRALSTFMLVTCIDRPFVHIVQQYTPTGDIAPTKTDHADMPVGRIVPIDTSTVRVLKAWRAEQRRLLDALGIEQSPTTPVITNAHGQFTNHYSYEAWFRKFCVEHKFGQVFDDDGKPIVELRVGDDAPDAERYDGYTIIWRDACGRYCDETGQRYSSSYQRPQVKRHYRGLVFHELRHSNFTIRLAGGTDVTTCQYLGGWSSPEILMKTYAHPVAETIWGSAGFMDGLANGFGGVASGFGGAVGEPNGTAGGPSGMK